jgi:hypothetical protein
MPSLPLQVLLLTVAGWMTRDSQRVTHYLLAENAVLREQLRGRRVCYTDAQRRRLATAPKKLGRKVLRQLDTLVTPDTLLRWYRRLVAAKYDRVRDGRKQPDAAVVELVLLGGVLNTIARPRERRSSGGRRRGATRPRGVPTLERLPEAGDHDVGRAFVTGRALRGRGCDRR